MASGTDASCAPTAHDDCGAASAGAVELLAHGVQHAAGACDLTLPQLAARRFYVARSTDLLQEPPLYALVPFATKYRRRAAPVKARKHLVMTEREGFGAGRQANGRRRTLELRRRPPGERSAPQPASQVRKLRSTGACDRFSSPLHSRYDDGRQAKQPTPTRAPHRDNGPAVTTISGGLATSVQVQMGYACRSLPAKKSYF